MRLLLVLITATLLLPGCLRCGFSGEGDQNFRRGNESMILCDNGGFAQVLETGIVEGTYAQENGVIVGRFGETTLIAFTFAHPEEDGWEPLSLEQTDQTHAHMQCEDLEARAWWTGE